MLKIVTKHVLIGLGALFLLLVGFLFCMFYIPRISITKQEPTTGLYYQIPLGVLYNKDFQLLVTKQTTEDIQSLQKEIDDRNYSSRSVLQSKPTTNRFGITYYHVRYEECYRDHVVSLEPGVNDGKELQTCSDVFGSVQDRYYISIGNDVYLFATPFPNRFTYHDFSFGGYPERISEGDFNKLIDSLRKVH